MSTITATTAATSQNGLANLSIFDRITNPAEAAKQLGAAIVDSKVFGCSNAGQGEVLAWECLVLRIPPLRLAQTYHLIMGKLTMRADAMLAGLVERGGTYVVKARTSEAAAIEITHRGQTETFALTWEECKNEPFAYNELDSDVVKMWAAKDPKKQPTLKTKYSTPRARMQMLWARVVSDGVRTMAPEVNSGRYTPEEFDDGSVIEGVATPVVEVPAITPEEAIKQAEAAYAAQQQPTLADKASAATPTAPTTPTASTTPTTPPPAAVADSHGHAAEPDVPGYATKLQRMELDRLWAACLIPPVAPEGQISQAAILRTKYKVESQRSLTQEQAATLIGNLTKKAAQLAAEIAAAPPPPPAEKSDKVKQREAEPSTPDQHLEIITALKALAQEPGGTAKVERFMAHLKSQGIERREQLSKEAAGLCLLYLLNESMDGFFKESLEKWTPPAAQ